MATPYKPNTRFKPWKIKIGDLVLVEGNFYSPEYIRQFIPAMLVKIDSVRNGTGIARFLSPEHGTFGVFVFPVVGNEEFVIRKENRAFFKRIPSESQT